jgi:hypothetical protein
MWQFLHPNLCMSVCTAILRDRGWTRKVSAVDVFCLPHTSRRQHCFISTLRTYCNFLTLSEPVHKTTRERFKNNNCERSSDETDGGRDSKKKNPPPSPLFLHTECSSLCTLDSFLRQLNLAHIITQC